MEFRCRIQITTRIIEAASVVGHAQKSVHEVKIEHTISDIRTWTLFLVQKNCERSLLDSSIEDTILIVY